MPLLTSAEIDARQLSLMEEIDIWRSANQLIKSYGDKAAEVAAASLLDDAEYVERRKELQKEESRLQQAIDPAARSLLIVVARDPQAALAILAVGAA